MSEEKTELKAWQLPNGKPKPEFRIKLRKPLSDGTTTLELSEPNAKTRRKAFKDLEMNNTGTGLNLTPDQAFGMKEILIAGVTGVDVEVVGELPCSELDMAGDYLLAFLAI